MKKYKLFVDFCVECFCEIDESDSGMYYEIEEVDKKIAALQDIIARLADPTGEDEDTQALILECVGQWTSRQ